MEFISLPRSDRKTSQLGFGCAFWPTIDESSAVRLIDAAYDAGIRHFDVAPYYLDGAAERFLGHFLSRRRDVSVTSKYGVVPASSQALPVKLARLLLKPLHRAVQKGVKLPMQRQIKAISRRKAGFSASDLERSLQRSLTLLQRDFIDILLFHEPDVDDFHDGELLNRVQHRIEKSEIGAIGIGTGRQQARELFAAYRGRWDVVQYDWNTFSGELPFPESFQIVYWVAGRNLERTCRELLEDRERSRQWSEKVDLDLRRPEQLRKLLLKSALLANKNGIVLNYSSNIDHIYQNVAVAEDASLSRSAATFLDLLRIPPR